MIRSVGTSLLPILLLCVFLCGCLSSRSQVDSQLFDPERATFEATLFAIAKDIEALKSGFPQLADFSAASHCHVERLEITYAFRTHRAVGRAGWVGGVPNPDDDGVWFTIDLHDPDSRAQIHTQPVMEDLRLGKKKVAFLILEGAQTSNLHQALSTILEKHGVRGPHLAWP